MHRTRPCLVLCGLLGLLSCESEALEPTKTSAAAPPWVEVATDGEEAKPIPLRWTQPISEDVRLWVPTVNDLNGSQGTASDTTIRPAATAYLQVDEGVELDEAALRAHLAEKRLTVVQFLTPADTGVAGGYVLECTAFT